MRTFIKNYLWWIVSLFIVLGVCGIFQNLAGMFWATKSHYISESTYRDEAIRGTFVWYHGHIIWSRIDNISTLTDSIVDARDKEADVIVKAINR